MSGRTSEYTIDIDIQDNTKEKIRGLERDLKSLGDQAAKASNDSFHAVNDAAKSMIEQLHSMTSDAGLDAVSIAKAFERSSQKTIGVLESTYIKLKDQRNDLQSDFDKYKANVDKYNADMAKATTEQRGEIRRLRDEEMSNLNAKQRELEALDSYIKQNKILRADLRSAAIQAKIEAAETKKKADVTKQRAKYEELLAKRKAAINKDEKLALDNQIKQQKALIKAIEQAEKAQKANGKAIEQNVTFLQKTLSFLEKLSKTKQYAYNTFGLVGGAARTVTGGIKAATGLLGGGLNAATQAADREVDKERQANRIKGFNKDDAKEILGELYIRTGSNDYGSIVDAINKVQGTLGKLSKEDLIAATEMEIRYPGMSVAFASSSYGADLANYNEYAAQLNAIQSATGASDEQIATSIRKFSNRKDVDASGGAISDYQAVYLALQNSGAFETEEEAEQAFNVFLKKQKASKQSVMEYAQSHDWTAGIHNDRDKLQVKNAMANMDWETFSKKLETAQASPSEGLQKSQSEQMAIQMRKVEEQKNKLLMTLIPAALPLVEAIAKMLEGGGAQLIADGLNDLFTIVVPVLLKVLNMLNDYILSPLLGLIKKLMDWLGEDNPRNDDDIVLPSSTSKNANGGIVWGTSIVGERGPEAIIPLDYSRAQRAENIAYSIQNNFSMSGNETTALSLAQAVSSRDFSRAMGKAAFKAGRLGAF